ncbi:MAG: prepilin peptidase [Synechococcaceae cyanobacterium SM2_3_2]|nr:prepilin peptidase [Synechococcaceae cyanobacterium SM2_3_2]
MSKGGMQMVGFYLLIWAVILYVGACVGSFLNVVVYRVPRGLSLIKPGSHCPHCKTPLGPTENVPILGWLWLRGRCRHCHAPISWRYPAVEALTMGLFALSFAVLGLSWQAASLALLWGWLVSLALIDLETFLLPEALTRSGLVVGIGVRIVLGWQADESAGVLASLTDGILGMVVGIWSLELVGLLARGILKKEAMGLGDGKLLAMIGMWIGWQGSLLTLLLGSGLGAVAGLVGMRWRRVQWGRPIPFGPYLALGGGLAALWGKPLLGLYLRLIGLD